jgi:hypothetical protein
MRAGGFLFCSKSSISVLYILWSHPFSFRDISKEDAEGTIPTDIHILE